MGDLYKNYLEKCQKDKEQQCACWGVQKEACWKLSQNEDFPLNKREIKHLKRSY